MLRSNQKSLDASARILSDKGRAEGRKGKQPFPFSRGCTHETGDEEEQRPKSSNLRLGLGASLNLTPDFGGSFPR